MVWDDRNLLINKFILSQRDTGWYTRLVGIYEYDSLDRIKKFRIEGGTYLECTYDEEGNLIYETAVYQENDEWKPDQRYVYVYSEITEVNENKSQSDIIFSPNPASDYIEIAINNKLSESYQIKIFNIYGEIMHTVGAHCPDIIGMPLRIDVSNFPNGIYFIRIAENIQKFVVLR